MRLRGAANVPRLQQMPTFVRGDDVEACREAVSEASDERVREAHAGEVDAGVSAEEASHVFLRREKRRHRLGEGR